MIQFDLRQHRTWFVWNGRCLRVRKARKNDRILTPAHKKTGGKLPPVLRNVILFATSPRDGLAEPNLVY